MAANESLLYTALIETVVEFFQKTSLNGFGLLYYIRRRKYQRIFWFIFILMGISFAVYVIVVTLIDFLEDPTVTTLDSEIPERMAKTPFPAVAVCSVNKISRQAASDYMRRISKRSVRAWKWETWLEKIKLFAGFFDSDTVDFDEAADIQSELEILAQGNFNASIFLRNLAPTCEDLLLKCYWSGSHKVCNELFSLNATVFGFCCMFNYKFGNGGSVELYVNGTGAEHGLVLLLNASSIDYVYNARNFIGFAVYLFVPNNFPDTSTGEVQEFFISPGEDIDVELTITTQISSPEVRDYSVAQRKCYFANELQKDYGSSYSRAHCLSRCKLQSVLALCECVPYYAPKHLFDPDVATDDCTLNHVECLEQHRVAWNTYRTADKTSSEKMYTAIDCSHCLPLCTYNSYQYNKIRSELRKDQHFARYRQMLESVNDMDSISLVKLYYSASHSIRYHEDVIFNWYQILSNIGGVIGICMGCSILSCCEIVYFFAFRYFEILVRLRRDATNI